MTTFKGPRFRIWNIKTDERVEVSAKNIDAALHKMGWINDRCTYIPLGSKIWLNEPKRYITPTRDFYD